MSEFVTCAQCKQTVPSNRSIKGPAADREARACTSCKAARAPVMLHYCDDEMSAALAEGCRTPGLIDCIGVVQFDLQVGQVLECLYPPRPFSQTQETEIAFLCFPDANHVDDGDTIHDFVYAFNESECDPSRDGVRRAKAATSASPALSPRSSDAPASSSPPTPASGATSPSSSGKRASYNTTLVQRFCSTMFRQRRDKTLVRGAQQKALLVMSHYAIPAASHAALRALCQGFFDTDTTLDTEELLAMAWRDLQTWPAPLPCRHFSSLPLLGTSVSFVSPRYDPIAVGKPTWSIPNPGFELTVHEATPLQRVRMAVERRVIDQRQLEDALSDWQTAAASAMPPAVIAWLENAKWDAVVRRFAADAPPIDTAMALVLATALHDVPDATAAAEELPAKTMTPQGEAALQHFRHTSDLTSDVVALQNTALRRMLAAVNRVLATAKIPDKGVSKMCQPEQVREELSEVEVHAALFPHLTKCWKFWELMMIGAPIAVYAPNAPVVSAMALSMPALMAPLPFVGLLRPYVTINNREIDQGINKAPHGATVVGATNPFFVRHLEQWPHLVCVNNDLRESTTHKTWPSTSPKREKQQFKHKNRMFCSRHYLVKTDTRLATAHIEPPAGKTVFIDESPGSPSPSREVLSTFRALTMEFIEPIAHYVAMVMQREQPYFVADSELRGMLSHRRVVEYLTTVSPPPPAIARFKNVKDAMEVFELFLLSPACQRWLQLLVRAHYRRFLLECVDSLEDVVRLTPTVAQRVTTLNNLQWDLERCVTAPIVDLPLLQKLSALCAHIPAVRERLVGSAVASPTSSPGGQPASAPPAPPPATEATSEVPSDE